MSSMHVSSVAAPPKALPAAPVKVRDADGDHDGTRAAAAASAPKPAALAPAGRPGSVVHEVA